MSAIRIQCDAESIKMNDGKLLWFKLSTDMWNLQVFIVTETLSFYMDVANCLACVGFDTDSIN